MLLIVTPYCIHSAPMDCDSDLTPARAALVWLIPGIPVRFVVTMLTMWPPFSRMCWWNASCMQFHVPYKFVPTTASHPFDDIFCAKTKFKLLNFLQEKMAVLCYTNYYTFIFSIDWLPGNYNCIQNSIAQKDEVYILEVYIVKQLNLWSGIDHRHCCIDHPVVQTWSTYPRPSLQRSLGPGCHMLGQRPLHLQYSTAADFQPLGQ